MLSYSNHVLFTVCRVVNRCCEGTWKIKLPPRLIQLLDIYQGYRTVLLIGSRWISLVADEWVP